uniref:Ras-associating domain-containing protein n=1 Tax=Syphacia muris TaxID=451379 RepID=A0A0N5ARB6_9BILA
MVNLSNNRKDTAIRGAVCLSPPTSGDLRGASSTPLRTQEGDILPGREQYVSPGSGRRATRMGVVRLPDYESVSPDTRAMHYLQVVHPFESYKVALQEILTTEFLTRSYRFTYEISISHASNPL